ncbi:MAG: hypothetical protein KJ060_13060 [Candidatus Hydrogenedentes bacterium]|nr:hypothetical protein [Candidatus Hydrogenedentota bacterium]
MNAICRPVFVFLVSVVAVMAGASESNSAALSAHGKPSPDDAASASDTSTESAARRVTPFTLEDQFGASHTYSFPRTRVSVLLLADKEGSKQVESWVVPLHERYGGRVDIHGVAELSAVPELMRGIVRFFFKRNSERPIMMDWEGAVTESFDSEPGLVNVYVVDTLGRIVCERSGEATLDTLADITATVDRLLANPETRQAAASKLE